MLEDVHGRRSAVFALLVADLIDDDDLDEDDDDWDDDEEWDDEDEDEDW